MAKDEERWRAGETPLAHTRTEEDDEKAELNVDVWNRTGSDTELE